MSVATQIASDLSGENAAVQTDGTLFHHAAFCRIGLPVQAPAPGGWVRAAGLDSIAMDPPAGEGDVARAAPSGKFLRLLLLHIFSTALRDDTTVVKLGDNAAELAEAIDADIQGPRLHEMEDQLARLLAAKVTVVSAGGPPLSLFDARGRAKADTAEWRSSVRLNARFHASLVQNSVKLDPRVVTMLDDSLLALDAYFFFAVVRPQDVTATPVPHGWDDLHARFAAPEQQAEEFRSAFEQALLLVCGADPTLGFFTNETGVTVRTVPARPVPVAAPVPAASAPQPDVAAPAVEAAPPRPVAEAPVPRQPRHVPQQPAQVAPPPVPREEAPIIRRAPPVPQVVQQPAPQQMQAESAQHTGAPRDRIGLKHHQTGLAQVVWLVRGGNGGDVTIEVTPGRRYDPDLLTVLALEPMVLQIRGGLNAGEFERVSAWATANRDLIDDFWDGDVEGEEEVGRRVKKVPAPGWR
jgi:hypothetical protein